jgi:hypothetical protein
VVVVELDHGDLDALHFGLRAALLGGFLALPASGTMMAARMPMMAMTAKISISVKPFRFAGPSSSFRILTAGFSNFRPSPRLVGRIGGVGRAALASEYTAALARISP